MDEIDETERDNFKTLTLDVDYYQSFLDDVDIPDDQKREFLETLWNIMVQFVDMGFSIEPTQMALESQSSQKSEFNAASIREMITQSEQQEEELETCP